VNVHDIDLNLLRVFDAVLHERGVTPAAGRLGPGRSPAVSNALARLRALFGDPLFLRTPGGMDATPVRARAGRAGAAGIGRVLESALAHGPGFGPATSTRAFRFYMSDLGQIEFLPPLIERGAGGRSPRRTAGSGGPGIVEDIAAALAAGALGPGGRLPPPAGAPVRPHALFRDPYVCLSARPTTGIKSINKEELFGCIARAGHLPRRPPRHRGGVRARRHLAAVALRVPHFTVVPMVLERTDLILTLPARVARVLREARQLQVAARCRADSQADVGVHWHERFEADAGNRWLREQIVELFREK
jgi:DNA-binding transcriptional LysR family regulator